MSWLVLPAACALTLLWWSMAFPPRPRVEAVDVAIEGVIALATLVGFPLIRRLGVRALTVGWALWAYANANNVADEFLLTPDVLDTNLEGALTIAGLALVVLGLHRAHCRRVAEVEARHASERERARLEAAVMTARAIAHDLNNHLAIVQGYTELMDTPDPLPVAEATPRIRAAVDEAARTLVRFQRVARFARGESPVGPVLALDEAVPVR